MNDIYNYRIRVINALKQVFTANASKTEEEPSSFDYKLDDLAREILNLPTRPKNSLPYVGWLKNSNSDNTSLRISQKGISLIKRWEGFRSNAYLCPANVWTIGYGHTKSAKRGQCISYAEAEALLKQDLVIFENGVNQLVQVKLTQHQFDALVSFAFNVGVYAFEKSTLLRKLNQKKYNEAANQFERWVYANKNKLVGLVRRRQEEKNLFLS